MSILFSAVDVGKMCMVIESPSGNWVGVGGGNDVVFRNEYCCLPENRVDGALCTKSKFENFLR